MASVNLILIQRTDKLTKSCIQNHISQGGSYGSTMPPTPLGNVTSVPSDSMNAISSPSFFMVEKWRYSLYERKNSLIALSTERLGDPTVY